MPTRPRILCTLAGALALAAGPAALAQAHITTTSDSAVAGAYAVVKVGVPHGCDGSSTIAIAIQIPEGINSVTPTRNAFYDVKKVMEKLDAPITDGHGNELSERVAQIVYTAKTPLPDGERDAFELSMKLPDDAGDTTLYFPTVQTCEKGESPWIEIPAEGKDPHDLELPAPSLAVSPAAETDDHGDHAHAATPSAGETHQGHDSGSTSDPAHADHDPGATSEPAHADHDPGATSGTEHADHEAATGVQTSGEPIGIAAIIVGSLGLLAGLLAFVTRRPRGR